MKGNEEEKVEEERRTPKNAKEKDWSILLLSVDMDKR